ncbi:MAG: aminotransferase class III-fold pyridoxal phosphate-dependent enzyme [Alphaproteobacteria bacterium]
MTATPLRNIDLDSAVDDAKRRYTEARPESLARFEKAQQSLPGGNTRSGLYYPPFPATIAGGKDARVWDVDGHDYTDFVVEYTAGLYGHSNAKIIAAVKQALDDGIVLGGHNTVEARFAEVLCSRIPSIERMRFCNSGTEANLIALSAMRIATGRPAVMAFKGAYHGSVLSFGGGEVSLNVPFPMVMADYNDLEGTMALIEDNATELAAVIIEPMIGAGGCISADTEFLQALRDATAKHGIILVFDEVMTSRLSPGGLQAIVGVTPDITTLGKYLGGGLTFGGFGGRADLMDRFDPRRADAYPHSGTFNNNILTMSAGYTGLTEVFTPEANLALNAAGDDVRARIGAVIEKHGVPAQVTGRGSMMVVHFCDGPMRGPMDAARSSKQASTLFHLDMMGRGKYVVPRGMINQSLPMTDGDRDGLVEAIDEFFTEYGGLLSAG